MRKSERPVYIPFKVSDEENAQIEYLMKEFDRDRSALIRYAIKKLYTETKRAEVG